MEEKLLNLRKKFTFNYKEPAPVEIKQEQCLQEDAPRDLRQILLECNFSFPLQNS
jgi:hypothetical protein